MISQPPEIPQESERYTSYELQQTDTQALVSGLNKIFDSDLLSPDTLKGLRVITFDSKSTYIFTRGTHKSTDKVHVNDISFELLKDQNNPHEFKVYKIKHSQEQGAYYFGKKDSNYRGGVAWHDVSGLYETIEDPEGIVNSLVAINGKQLSSAKVFMAPPAGPYTETQGDKYDYETDVLAHEGGHIEEGPLNPAEWKMDYEASFEDTWKLISKPFPSDDSEQTFISMIKSSKFPQEIKTYLLETHQINRKDLSEAYAMMVDNEAKRLFGVYENRSWISKKFEHYIKGDKFDDKEEWLTDSEHIVGRTIMLILEAKFPDFQERKAWFQGILKGS